MKHIKKFEDAHSFNNEVKQTDKNTEILQSYSTQIDNALDAYDNYASYILPLAEELKENSNTEEEVLDLLGNSEYYELREDIEKAFDALR